MTRGFRILACYKFTRIMTKEEFIDDIEEKQMVAMAKLDSYRKVIDNVKRMYESSERKVRESKMAMERYGDSSAVSVNLKQKALQAKTARDVYYDVLMDVAKAAKVCKEAMMRDVREFNEEFDGMQE